MTTIHARRISKEQSEIWIDGEDKHIAATTWVLAAFAKLCEPEDFKAFLREFEMSNEAKLSLKTSKKLPLSSEQDLVVEKSNACLISASHPASATLRTK